MRAHVEYEWRLGQEDMFESDDDLDEKVRFQHICFMDYCFMDQLFYGLKLNNYVILACYFQFFSV